MVWLTLDSDIGGCGDEEVGMVADYAGENVTVLFGGVGDNEGRIGGTSRGGLQLGLRGVKLIVHQFVTC